MLRFFSLLLFCYSADSSSVPFITKCRAEDNKCLKEVTQTVIPIVAAGLPEYGVEPLDPIFLKTLDASSPGLTLKLKDITGTGLKACVVKKAQRDAVKSKLIFTGQCTAEFNGTYVIDGQLLVLPIKGSGDVHVILRKLLITIDSDLNEINGKDGQKHWKIKDYKFSYELKDKSTIELHNLFSENEVLGRAARDLISSNSNEVIKEIGTPIVRAVTAKIVENINRFFKGVPLSDLIVD